MHANSQFLLPPQKKHFFHQSKMKMKHTTKALACTSIAKYSHKWKGPYNPYIYITLKFQKKFVAFHHFLLRICAKKCCDCKPSWPRPFFPLVVKCDLFQQLYHTLKITTMSISYPKTLPHTLEITTMSISFLTLSIDSITSTLAIT